MEAREGAVLGTEGPEGFDVRVGGEDGGAARGVVGDDETGVGELSCWRRHVLVVRYSRNWSRRIVAFDLTVVWYVAQCSFE